VPKSGFINAADYKSPKELANYLNYLDSNKTAYNSYFKWKKHVKFDLANVNFGNYTILINLRIKIIFVFPI
jgi:hypothetical protein